MNKIITAIQIGKYYIFSQTYYNMSKYFFATLEIKIKYTDKMIVARLAHYNNMLTYSIMNVCENSIRHVITHLAV